MKLPDLKAQEARRKATAKSMMYVRRGRIILATNVLHHMKSEKEGLAKRAKRREEKVDRGEHENIL